jgi:hypothetical protein
LLTITPILEHNYSAPFIEYAAASAETSPKMSRMWSFAFSTHSSLRRVLKVTGESIEGIGAKKPGPAGETFVVGATKLKIDA